MITCYDQQLYQKRRSRWKERQNSHFSNSWPTKSPFYRTNFEQSSVYVMLVCAPSLQLLLVAHTTIFVVILLLYALLGRICCKQTFSRVPPGQLSAVKILKEQYSQYVYKEKCDLWQRKAQENFLHKIAHFDIYVLIILPAF